MASQTEAPSAWPGMTDTEILDYFEQSLKLNPTRMPQDVQIGSIVFTTGLRPAPLRELIMVAINRDKLNRGLQIARILEN